jgi:acyl-CoA synthetase (AMP-forming)/AMP-acid ligase II
MVEMEGLEALADVPRLQAIKRGSAIALTLDNRNTTFAELNERSSRIANKFLAEGVKPDGRIAYLAKNTDVFFEILFGAAKARAVLAPVNFRLAAPEVAYILGDSGAEILFVDAFFRPLAEAAIAELPKKPKLIALDFKADGYADFEAWRASGDAKDPKLAAKSDDDVLQLYTSGTTGNPKGVQLTNGNFVGLFSLVAGVPGFNYEVGESVIDAMPQFHVAGTNIGLAALASGARAVVIKDLVPADVLRVLQEEKINHAFFVPAVILMLMQAPEMEGADLSALRGLTYGASPIAEDLLVRAKARFGCSFTQLYGMTETTGAGTQLPDHAHAPGAKTLRSCGISWPGCEVKIVDDNMKEVAFGEVGEVVIKGPIIMKGYWNNPKATADSIRDGWMRTGDAAYQTDDGFFYIHDRLKDMIVTGGENVYPAEVENAIFGHPDITDVAVIGVPDEKWGEAVKAIVVLKPGVEKNSASIIAWARERIANYKTPKSVDFIDVIPRNPSGKILRRELRKPYWEGRTRMVS